MCGSIIEHITKATTIPRRGRRGIGLLRGSGGREPRLIPRTKQTQPTHHFQFGTARDVTFPMATRKYDKKYIVPPPPAMLNPPHARSTLGTCNVIFPWATQEHEVETP